ncbi:uncharacterized protein LOC129596464 isoform X2 [Paramacrobiotus metropolitanus]|uniref:uncharacterized protein LOC129596464 isoform X2 n=1 Tax=Paramacrobiotus metropolitanus TaxID=2943436 RepID=UPI0024457DA1|nr:uncharacterized protein LOC129596464 isoform X2 [Paramacrobiotus metropolitanus]
MDRDNAVYVQGRDERMRYGRVVDVAEDGLFIDLLCRNRRREYAPFGSVFFPDLTSSQDLVRLYTLQRSGVPLEVLVPETPSGPWIWLPGKISCQGPWDKAGGAIVRWRSPDSGALCSDFIPAQRLRSVPDANVPAVQQGSFIKRSVDLGKKYRSLTTEESGALVKRLNSYSLCLLSPVFMVELVDGKLHYIYKLGNAERSISPRKVLSKFVIPFHKQLLKIVKYPLTTLVNDNGKTLALPAQHLVGHAERSTASDGGTSERDDRFHKKFFRLFRRSAEKSKPEAKEIGVTMPLPAELWQEVFSHLDTVTQTKLRVVCVTWNRLLDAPALRSTLVIRDNYKEGRFGHYPSLASIFKCLLPGIERIVITHLQETEGMSRHYARMVFDLIQYAVDHQLGNRLRTVHLHRVRLQFLLSCRAECAMHQSAEHTYYWLQKFTAKYQRWHCHTVHLVDCVVVLDCEFYTAPPRGFKAHSKINIGTLRLPGNDDCSGREFWDALEAALPLPHEQELRKLFHWLTVCRDSSTQFYFEKAVCKILCATQSFDPRPWSHYRGKLWCLEGLRDLQLKKLSRVTLYFLVEVQKQTAARGLWLL